MNLKVSKAVVDESEFLETSMSVVASAIADPSRVSILCALMDGRAWTATELSSVANIAASTTSAHLAKLLNSRLVTCLSQGRHRYYRLAGNDIAALLETLMVVSAKSGKTLETKTPSHLRVARTCYDHMAGEVAVGIYNFMFKEGWFSPDGNLLSPMGKLQFQNMGVFVNPNSRRKSSCACLDWSERRFHLGGSAGAALMLFFEQKGWITKIAGYREVTITEKGKAAFLRLFQLTVN